MKKTDLAYTAGIIDGEGSIGIYPQRQGNKSIAYALQVVVASTDEWLPLWLKFAYGGNIHNEKRYKEYHSPCWAWSISTRQAGEFLKLVLPYLHLKRPQAELAIQFQSRKHNWGGKGKPQVAKILDEADAILMKKYNKKGTKNV